MDREFKAKLELQGVDVEGALERFIGNDVLYEKFLRKFFDDVNYTLLIEGINQKDVKKAFDASHTLKGVSANLGLNQIVELISPMVEVFRNESVDIDISQLEKLKKKYEDLYSLIKQYL